MIRVVPDEGPFDFSLPTALRPSDTPGAPPCPSPLRIDTYIQHGHIEIISPAPYVWYYSGSYFLHKTSDIQLMPRSVTLVTPDSRHYCGYLPTYIGARVMNHDSSPTSESRESRPTVVHTLVSVGTARKRQIHARRTHARTQGQHRGFSAECSRGVRHVSYIAGSSTDIVEDSAHILRTGGKTDGRACVCTCTTGLSPT